MPADNRDLSVFRKTLDRPVAFHPVLARISGSVAAGLMLSQAVYWSDKGSDGVWFYKTQEQWTRETTLSRYEQETARAALKKKGLLQEQKRGIPCKIFFHVDLGRIYQEIENLESPPARPRESRNQGCGNPATKDAGIPQPIKGTESTTETTKDIPPTPQNDRSEESSKPEDQPNPAGNLSAEAERLLSVLAEEETTGKRFIAVASVARRSHLSKPAVRRALQELRGDGRIVSRKGAVETPHGGGRGRPDETASIAGAGSRTNAGGPAPMPEVLLKLRKAYRDATGRSLDCADFSRLPEHVRERWTSVTALASGERIIEIAEKWIEYESQGRFGNAARYPFSAMVGFVESALADVRDFGSKRTHDQEDDEEVPCLKPSEVRDYIERRGKWASKPRS